MEKFKKKVIRILSENLFSEIMLKASFYTRIPYRTEYAIKAWYRSGLFKKVDGYILTGFKMKWPNIEDGSVGVTSSIGMSKMFEALNFADSGQIPVKSVFVEKSLFDKIKLLKINGCDVTITDYRKISFIHKDFGRVSCFCPIVSELFNKLDDVEVRKLKSIKFFTDSEEGYDFTL